MDKQLLIEFFSKDSELFEQYHILAPNSAEVCAERTLKDIENSKIYLLKKEDKVIGYYGIDGISLTGFFIVPEERNPDTINLFWKEVKEKFNGDFYCGLYNRNTRAINFVRKQTIIQEYPVEQGIFFKIKR